jgi:hypothetical protein
MHFVIHAASAALAATTARMAGGHKTAAKRAEIKMRFIGAI